MPTPAFEKDNPLTRAMREVSEHNRRMRGGGGSKEIYVTAGKRPAVTTPAMRDLSMAPDGEPPPLESILTPDEIARREALLNGAEPPPGSPQSFETSRMTARQITQKHMPDFTKLEAIDFINGTVVIDGLSIRIPEGNIKELSLYCVNLVMDTITQELAKALVEFGGGMSERENEKVQPTPPSKRKRAYTKSGKKARTKSVSKTQSNISSGEGMVGEVKPSR